METVQGFPKVRGEVKRRISPQPGPYLVDWSSLTFEKPCTTPTPILTLTGSFAILSRNSYEHVQETIQGLPEK